jgi:hypothetical protein
MLAIQEYISLFSDIREANHHLTVKLGIHIYEDLLQAGNTAMENVYIYNSSSKSPLEDPITQEANGLILNGSGEIVSMGFKRFYNAHKPYAAKIEYGREDAKAQLMDDGTLIVIFYYKGNWFIQTKQRANGDQVMRGSQITIRIAVTEVLKAMFKNRPFAPFDDYPNRDMCYIFEYVSPYNKGITPYHDSTIILLGVVHKGDIREMSDSWVNAWMVNYCRSYRFGRPQEYYVGDLEDALSYIKFVQPLRKGLVIKDCHGNRVSLMNPEYTLIKRLVTTSDKFSPHLFARIALSEDGNRVTALYPQFRPIIDMFHDTLKALNRLTISIWATSRSITDKKAFSEAVSHQPPIVKSILFMMRRNQIDNLRVGLEKIRPKTLTNAVKWRFGSTFTQEMNKLELGGS